MAQDPAVAPTAGVEPVAVAPTAGAEAVAVAKEVSPTLALSNGRVVTMEGEIFENGRIVIAGEKILAVGGQDLPLPQNVPLVDATGLTLMPGWIDVQSRLWMSDSNDDGGTSDGSHQAIDSLDPFNEDWNEVIEGGVTSVYVQPSSRGAMSGLGAVVSVVPKSDGTLAVHSPAAALQMSLGSAPSNRERLQRYEALKKSIQSLVDYKKKRDEYQDFEKGKKEELEKAKTKEEATSNTNKDTKPTTEDSTPPKDKPKDNPKDNPKDKPKDSSADKPKEEKAKVPTKPDTDPVKERLLGVLNGSIPIRLEIHTANDYHFASKLWDEFQDLQWIVEGADELKSASKLLSDRHPPLVLGPWLDLSSNPQSASKRWLTWKELLGNYKGSVVFGTGRSSASASRMLREHLALAVASGVDSGRALEGVTIAAARVLGVSDKVGSIAVGKLADIVGFAGDPLDTTVPVTLVVVGGNVIKKIPSQVTSAPIAAKPTTDLATLPSHYRLRSRRVLLPSGLSPATLIISDGKITGIETEEPDTGIVNPPLVDLGHSMVTPGLFSSHATLALNELTRGGADSNTAWATAADISIRGTSQQRQLQAGGVYGVAFSNAPTNPIAGQISLMATDEEGTVMRPGCATKIILNDSSRRPDRFPSSLAGQAKLVREALGGTLQTSRLFLPEETIERLTQAKQSVASQIIDRKQVAVFEVSDEAEVGAALQLIERFKLRGALVGARDWKPFADRIKALEVAVIVAPLDLNGYSRVVDEVVACHKLGIPIFFGGDTAMQLRATASACVRAGLPAETALASMTMSPSLLFGTPAGELGLQTGLAADLVVWSDSPLNLSSRPLALIRRGTQLILEGNP